MFKKLLLSLTVLASSLSAYAADAKFVVWPDGTKGKTGCPALVEYAKNNGISKQDDDSYQFIFSGNDKDFTLSFNQKITVRQGDLFCMYYSDDTNSWDWHQWLHHSATPFPSENTWGNVQNDSDMKFGETVTFNRIDFKVVGDNSYKLSFYVDIERSAPSDFAIEVWALQENATWDTAGGLYAPFNKNGYWKERFVHVDNEPYPLAARYKGAYKQDPNKPLLLFNGPLTDDEMTKYGDHAKHFASTDYKGKEVLGFDKEDETELYVIDFTEGNDLRGLYVQVPTVPDMEIDNWSDEEKSIYHTEPFYRMGVRFGFLDRSYEQKTGDGYNDHLRYVKWGHCFRLNEFSRPLNAFPILNDNKDAVVGYKDDFGPCDWNGVNVKENDNGSNDAIPESGLNAYRNKRGDSRILAERNFWLKRIFLEVAYADDAKKFKRFYLYFDGEYDLSNQNARSFAQDFYHPANEVNYVGKTPNIWHGSNLAAAEAGFCRFYNLDTNNIKDFIGIDLDEYNTRRGQGRYLYNMDFTDGYQVNSEYQAVNAKDEVVKYIAGADVARKLEYFGEGGDFFLGTPENKGALLETSFNEKKLISINALEVALIFNPDDEAQLPEKIKITNKYKFPNMAFETVVDDTYDFDGAHIKRNVELPLTGNAIGHTEDWDLVTASLDWSSFTSILPNASSAAVALAAEGDVEPRADAHPYPVANYVVSAYVDQNSTINKDADFKVVSNGPVRSLVSLGHNNTFWAGDAKMAAPDVHIFLDNETAAAAKAVEKCYAHVRVDAYYNICWPTQGILKKERLYTDAAMTQPSELLTNAGVFTDLGDERQATVSNIPGHSDLKDPVTYNITPRRVSSYVTIPFDKSDTLTGIDDVTVDTDAPARYFDLQGREVVNPTHGTYIIVKGDKANKIKL